MKKLYWVYFESATYCGYGENVAVWAKDKSEAEELAFAYAEDFYYQQDIEQLEEDGYMSENGDFDGDFATIKSVEEFGPGHKDWEFYANPKPGRETCLTLGTKE